MQGKTWRPLRRRYSPDGKHINEDKTRRDSWTFTTLLLLQQMSHLKGSNGK